MKQVPGTCFTEGMPSVKIRKHGIRTGIIDADIRAQIDERVPASVGEQTVWKIGAFDRHGVLVVPRARARPGHALASAHGALEGASDLLRQDSAVRVKHRVLAFDQYLEHFLGYRPERGVQAPHSAHLFQVKPGRALFDYVKPALTWCTCPACRENVSAVTLRQGPPGPAAAARNVTANTFSEAFDANAGLT